MPSLCTDHEKDKEDPLCSESLKQNNLNTVSACKYVQFWSYPSCKTYILSCLSNTVSSVRASSPSLSCSHPGLSTQ